MSSSAADPRTGPAVSTRDRSQDESFRGVGSAWFVGTLLMIVGVVNFFYGIAAVANSSFYAAGERYVFGDLHTWQFYHDRSGRHPVHRGILAVRRQHVWARDRHRRRHLWRDRVARQCRRRAPLVVPRRLCDVSVGHSRVLRARRAGKGVSGGRSQIARSPVTGDFPVGRSANSNREKGWRRAYRSEDQVHADARPHRRKRGGQRAWRGESRVPARSADDNSGRGGEAT